jgi:histidine decarboxylase
MASSAVQIVDEHCGVKKAKTSHQSYTPAAFLDFVADMEKAEAEVAAQPPMLGYPMNNHELQPLLKVHGIVHRDFTSNNCGDPLGEVEKPWRTHTLHTERTLLRLLMAPWGGDETSAWGYVTTGGTEGVMKGMMEGYERLVARGYKKVLVAMNSVSHYSIPKAAVAAAPTSTHALVPVGHDNAMKLEEVEKLLAASKLLGYDAILMVATIGTTFFGGCDDVRGIQALLTKYGYSPGDASYLHLDAALHGGFWHDSPTAPKYQLGSDFDSVSISGHKWFGGFVAGVVMITHHNKPEEGLKKAVEYVGMVDKFVSGSRNGASAVLWLARIYQFDWPAELERCLGNAEYLIKSLRELGVVAASQNINVLMPRPSPELAHKWQLMCVGDEAQVLMMPHVLRPDLEAFVEDVKADVAKGALHLPSARLTALSGM